MNSVNFMDLEENIIKVHVDCRETKSARRLIALGNKDN